jgi:hypothetical protein
MRRRDGVIEYDLLVHSPRGGYRGRRTPSPSPLEEGENKMETVPLTE